MQSTRTTIGLRIDEVEVVAPGTINTSERAVKA
jgi:hypothetical protein